DEALGLLAAEELVEQVAAVVQGALGGQRHLVACAAGVGQRLARELIQRAVDGLGLGEAGGGVGEVGHRVTRGGRRRWSESGREGRLPRTLATMTRRSACRTSNSTCSGGAYSARNPSGKGVPFWSASTANSRSMALAASVTACRSEAEVQTLAR